MDTEPRPRWFRRRFLLVGSLVLAAGIVSASFAYSSPRHRGPVSDHFDGAAFRNQVTIPRKGLWDILTWQLSREGHLWDGYAPDHPVARPEPRVAGRTMRVTRVGHSTVLLQTAGLNILIDPIWSERCSPLSWFGPRRVTPPAIQFEDLPPIDVVLVSHNHYDHLDLPTLKRLGEAHAPTMVVPLGNAALLTEHGISGGRELDWWQGMALAGDVSVTCVPAQHFSGRGLWDRDASLWGGFVLETPGGVVYYAGDTGTGPHFAQVLARFGSPRLALLPIGAYEPQSIMRPVHLRPREAVEVHRLLGARTSLAVHYGCFELSDEGPLAPVEELSAAMAEFGVAREAFWELAPGVSRDVP